MKKLLKALNVAFSMYSKIPMPRFVWGTEDMKYHLCFFPVVGLTIGGCIYGWYRLSICLAVSTLGRNLIAMAIPLIITGGFHVDGFMDTMDALSSYREKEKKLEILKDPHIGAFSVITLLTAVLVTVGFLQEIHQEKQVLCLAGCFIVSRVVSGLCVTTLNNPKEAGMLKTTMDTAGKGVVRICLAAEGMLTLAVMAAVSLLYAGAAFLGMGAVLVWFLWMIKKNFGGITGDLAGCLVVMCEVAAVVGVSAAGMIRVLL